MIADVPKDTPTPATFDPLPVSGANPVHRVYAMLSTDNGRGSNNTLVSRA